MRTVLSGASAVDEYIAWLWEASPWHWFGVGGSVVRPGNPFANYHSDFSRLRRVGRWRSGDRGAGFGLVLANAGFRRAIFGGFGGVAVCCSPWKSFCQPPF